MSVAAVVPAVAAIGVAAAAPTAFTIMGAIGATAAAVGSIAGIKELSIAGATIAAARMSQEGQDRRLDKQMAMEEKKLAADVDKLTKLQTDPDGNAFTVNPVNRKVEPLIGADGEQMKFRDPDVLKAQQQLIKSATDQLSDLNRTYVPQIQALETTVRKLQSDPMLQADESARRELEETQARLKSLTDRFTSERKPLIRELKRITDTLMPKAGVSKIDSEEPGEQPTGVIRYDAQGNRLGPDGKPQVDIRSFLKPKPQPQYTPAPPGSGLINTVPGGVP